MAYIDTGDVAPIKYGKWTGRCYNFIDDIINLKDSHYLYCSNCNHKHYLHIMDLFGRLHKCNDGEIYIPKYCPNCGAIMKDG